MGQVLLPASPPLTPPKNLAETLWHEAGGQGRNSSLGSLAALGVAVFLMKLVDAEKQTKKSQKYVSLSEFHN